MKTLILVSLALMMGLNSHAQKNINNLLKKGKKAYHKAQYTKAITCLDKVLKLDLRNSEAYTWKALSHSGLKEYKDAFEAFEAALNLSPTADRYKHRAAMKSAMAFSGMELLELCDCGTYIMPSASGKTDIMAYYQSIAQDYEEAIKVEDSNADTYYRAAINYYYLGNYNKTCTYIEKAKTLGHEKPIPPKFTEQCK
ncbi:MAG: hypothetical protein GY810_30380 [Aureispira sp.]|nr:hypothetical protein [Aureispira sp.]